MSSGPKIGNPSLLSKTKIGSIPDAFLLSVIIPVYNGEEYIKECIDSLDLGSNPDVEFVVVDDGSTDKTAEFCNAKAREYRNLKVFHKPNGGSASARNYGLVRSRGAWVWFVDSDDIVSPYAFETIRRSIAKWDVDVIYYPLCSFFDKKELAWKDDERDGVVVGANAFLRDSYSGKYCHYNCSFVFSRDLLERCASGMGHSLDQLYREDIILYEDALFCETFLRESQRILVSSTSIYAYRRNPKSITNKQDMVVAASGLRAVRLLSKCSIPPEAKQDHLRMEIGLLFSVYKLIGSESGARSLKKETRNEISRRIALLGFSRLGMGLKIRYILMITKMMDLIIKVRDCRYAISR